MAIRIPVNDADVAFTSSFGVSKWQPGESVDDMLRRADIALYAAKEKGRNCVVCADDNLSIDDYDSAGRPVRGAPRSDGPARVVPATPRSAA